LRGRGLQEQNNFILFLSQMNFQKSKGYTLNYLTRVTSNDKNICCDHNEKYSIVNCSVALRTLRRFEQISDGLTLPVYYASLLFVKYTEIVEDTNNFC
jgi:hypothetical protein